MRFNLRSALKRLLPYRIYYLLFEVLEDLKWIRLKLGQIDKNNRRLAAATVPTSHLLLGSPPSVNGPINAHELSIYSQNGEDGILMYIFSKIGVKSKIFVEFGVEDGRECNAANLAINHGWRGLFIDGGGENVSAGLKYYGAMLGDCARNVAFIQAFVTAENINELIARSGIEGEVDLLSIDIDGNDYWVWKAIDKINPRVVVIEYNASFGSDKLATIPYNPAFVWNSKKSPDVFFTGASLALLEQLGQAKGYSLVGCDSNGVNAFFVRTDAVAGVIPAVSAGVAYFPHAVRTQRFGIEGQAFAVAQLSLHEPRRTSK